MLASDVYPDLALATHRTLNRPMPVQPVPELPDPTSAGSEPPLSGFSGMSFGEQASPVSEDERPPEIIV